MKLACGSSTSLLLPLALTAVLAGCAGSGAAQISTGTGGSTGGSCQTITCVPKIVTPLGLAVEIAPPASSGAGLTENLNPKLDQSSGPVSLVADAQIPVTATFTASSNAPVPTNANIVLDIPSIIPGRPDLIFQASASPTGAPAASTAQLSIPQGPITAKTTGTLSLIPLPPSDQQSPPYSSQVTLDPNEQPVVLAAGLPTDNFSISGALSGALSTVDSFVARAYQGGLQVSNAPVAVADGSSSFFLAIPAAVAKAGGLVTVQLSPQSPNDALFVFDPFTVPNNPVPTTLSLGKVSLAPYQAPNQFSLSVVTNDAAKSPVSNVFVQLQTNLPGSLTQQPHPGSTQFSRSGTTNGQGIASLSLLPGSQDVTIAYTALVIPPRGSPYATTCSTVKVDKAGAAGVSTPGAPPIGPATVSRRTVLSGRVENSGGYPVANVAVTATPVAGSVSGCPGTSAQPASATTDSQGNYSLPLDPGTTGQPVTYQLDFDPPADSSAPRFTQPAVAVDDSAPTLPHDVTLPPGGLVAGIVMDSSSPPNPLPSATVRLFQPSPQCSSYSGSPCSTPPLLRGQAVTDSSGQFQIVVWLD